jgi:hypothetical protein
MLVVELTTVLVYGIPPLVLLVTVEEMANRDQGLVAYIFCCVCLMLF